MARKLTAEVMLQGNALSSIGAYPCRVGLQLHAALQLERWDNAGTGRPVVRW